MEVLNQSDQYFMKNIIIFHGISFFGRFDINRLIQQPALQKFFLAWTFEKYNIPLWQIRKEKFVQVYNISYCLLNIFVGPIYDKIPVTSDWNILQTKW